MDLSRFDADHETETDGRISVKLVTQYPREVAAKFGKRIDTFLGQNFPEAKAALAQWLTHLDETEPFGPEDPAFPTTVLRTSDAELVAASQNSGHLNVLKTLRSYAHISCESGHALMTGALLVGDVLDD